MASLQRQSSQRRQQAHSSPPATTPARSRSPSTASRPTPTVDSPLLVTGDAIEQGQLQGLNDSPRAIPQQEEEKKCWICFSDSTEDTVNTSPWRDPCPCALVAHEQCLLDWIADVESPKNNNNRGGALSAPRILCPQCKSEIKLSRPRSYVVDIVRAFDRHATRAIMPAAALAISTDVLYKTSLAYGMHSVRRIFSPQDAARILGPIIRASEMLPLDLSKGMPAYRDRLLAAFQHSFYHWRLYFGLPLITPVLLLSRTNWHFSEAFLTVLPTVFFALQPSSPDEIFNFARWPPSASMSFALLPYVRQAYNLYYEKVWGEKVRRWKRELLPAATQAQPDANADRDPAARIEDAVDENVFEIRVDGGIWEEGEDAEAAPEAAQDAAPAPNVPDNRAQDAARREMAAERRLSFSPAALAASVLGALAFPNIAEISGEVLILLLPKSWAALPATKAFLLPKDIPLMNFSLGSERSRSNATGLLQEKWGRSLIGGCLFVVLKDALMLYVRWKMAQMHRNRKVLDYDRSKAKI